MAGMRAVHKKNGTTFKYSGDLKETIEKAEKELKEKEGTTQWLFLKWQYDNARKAFEKYNRRLEAFQRKQSTMWKSMKRRCVRTIRCSVRNWHIKHKRLSDGI